MHVKKPSFLHQHYLRENIYSILHSDMKNRVRAQKDEVFIAKRQKALGRKLYSDVQSVLQLLNTSTAQDAKPAELLK